MTAEPTRATKEALVQVRMPEELVDAINEWRRRQPDIPTRSEAIRRLVEKALDAPE